MPPSKQAFLDALRDSALLDRRQLDQALDRARGTADQHKLARQLVAEHVVTGWQAEQLLAGRRQFLLGRYRLLELAGRGGMGRVYKAEHVEMRRIVALKVMSRRLLGDPRSVERFLREIRSAAALTHPNIVAAYDADCVDDRYFLVTEYVAGRTLEQWQREGRGAAARGGAAAQDARFLVGWSCECARQVALGLQHAAEHGVVHRDIKPSNLIVRQAGAASAASAASDVALKILDFGLACFVSGAGENGELTRVGRTVGTIEYMAPEQAGSSRQVDVRADIYSLGSVLFHLLAGRLPFEDDSPVRRLAMRLEQRAPRLSAFRPDIPMGLDRTVARMLQRDPDRRFQSPAEAAEALARYATARDVTAPFGAPPVPVDARRP